MASREEGKGGARRQKRNLVGKRKEKGSRGVTEDASKIPACKPEKGGGKRISARYRHREGQRGATAQRQDVQVEGQSGQGREATHGWGM